MRTLCAIAIALGTALWLASREPGADPSKPFRQGTTLKAPPPKLPPYRETVEQIDTQRRELAHALAHAPSGGRGAVLEDTRRLLERSLARDLPSYWLGTAWDFNGVSQTPGEGQIACGYFVSTLLRDAGFRVERTRLGQQASGNIIRTLTSRSNVKRLVGRTFEDFLTELKAAGPGVYVIGLDRHVGLIVSSGGRAAFIHSDGGRNKCVVVEPVENSVSLRRSRWREFANLCEDEALLEKWLAGAALPTAL